MGGIPVESLSRCYGDAVQAAQRLRIRHLWIDSLWYVLLKGRIFVLGLIIWLPSDAWASIIQDFRDDWETEAVSMDRVYSNGVCNLAACDGQDSSHGLAADRDPWAGANIWICQLFRDGLTTITLMPDWVTLTRDYASLHKRGRAVQERSSARG
ncbi:hypothetical protein HIM_06068 [Hirsutella minnesotensis 3608]|uniref:Heterokaryon incompatibility domain-containing protein n=1 Tax=Hirsutella minnesotensis 3608 TaxID=1043627 RepID=A0A0F7ZZM3_9HYPO|nr:hypothetical protein HIM_06068 [Hirsutella minnesotensis 3608]